MHRIVGNTVGVPNPQSDWNQTDETKADFIKNKPDIKGEIDETKKDLQVEISNLEIQIGDIETALDNIIAIQNSLIGGDA